MAVSTKESLSFKQEIRFPLEDGKITTVYITQHRHEDVRPRLVVFDAGMRLVDWCNEQSVLHAIGGGFFDREARKPLGDVWTAGQPHDTIPFDEPWHTNKGSLQINNIGKLALAPRYLLPQAPEADLLQAGPLLVQAGKSVVSHEDKEGFSRGSHQFDSDITDGRYPRAAIGMNEEYIWCVAADGRHQKEAGLTIGELADIFVMLGADQALNLDGGSSSSLVHDGKLINKPRSNDELFALGRPIHTAIIFEKT